MKKYFYIFTLFFLQAIIAACTDNEIYDSSDNGTGSSIKIILNIPVDNGKTRGLIYGSNEDPIDGESVIKDVYALAFEKSSGKYLGKLQSYMSDGSLISKIDVNEIGLNELTIVVLTNLESLENGNELISQINALTKGNIIKTEVLKSLKYTFTSKWVLADRPLPMWGETDVTPIKESTAVGTINLYRSISKINVVVNNGSGRQENDIDVFKLKSVRVYYARTSGLAGSLHAPVANEEGGSNTIINPSIPEGVDYFPRYDNELENNLLFEEETEGGSYAIENKIYVPESDQTNTEEPMCLVVGGYYMGSTQETYYRVDFKQGNKGTEFYNAIRNHIYTFNINNVTRPGTDEPDPALDHVVVGMDVSIKDWTTEWMRGIGGQYTLEVEAGGLLLESTNTGGNELWVKSTHNNGWNISEQSGDWFTVTPKADKSGVILTAYRENFGGQRRGSFVITSGNLSKVIMVRQKGKGTANCYVVSDNGEHILQDLIVTVKGNGEDGLIADGHPLEDQEPNLAPDDVKIIWQTAKDLVTLKTDAQGKTIINENGIVQFQIDLTKQNADIVANSNYPDQQGGNALIGAFKDGEIIWTWHLWVCPDLDANKNGYVDDNELEACTQTWNTGFGYGYEFLDRYLGALTNKPGLTSLGLLYQWGRKDPFIGAAKISETLTGNRMDTKNLTGYGWKNSTSNMSIEESIKNPTTLINGTITGTDYSFLWGTDKGFTTVRDAGNKTIYDPCPAGYRVPPVSSIVFTNGSRTSEDYNYNFNVTWWPNASSSTYVSPNKTDSYGFWLNCNSASSKPSGINTWSTYGNHINNVAVTNAAWLPLAGVYDGNINNLAKVDGENSVVVNSIIWTNSSIKAGNSVRPGALFLHGRESNNSANGRHLHRLIENDNALYAKATHAGSVRCIKDTKASIQNAIQVPEEITLGYANGSYVDEILTSITESWEVIDPGAMWFVMTPDQGTAGSQQYIKFTATSENTGTTARSAVLKIKFSDGSIRNINVTQRPSVPTINLTFAYNATSSSSNQSVNIGTSSFTWETIPSNPSLTTSRSGSNLRVRPSSSNTTGSERKWVITVKNSQGKIIYYINVTQRSR